MENESIGLLMLGIFWGIGFLLLVIGLIVKSSKENMLDRCTKKTTGEVVGFSAYGKGIYLPIVQYEVRGSSYKGKLIYRWTVSRSSTLTKNSEVTSDIFGHTLSVKRNSILSTNPIASVLPIGTALDVYYNAAKPQENYIQRRPKSLVPDIFIWTGIIFIVLGILFYYLFSQIFT
ncbi:DUF3592 domain-containing protein [Desemzia sp. RIT804]|uniref:DUF3592 domain-containing protein n=1 Tax=Desemzia sp. RIT 804 TaxID=2810209 RepID=UPI00194FB57F|nr:DUF3592 domain-containing protein [Desemzia sp. RIT 804]MBM6613396.1 DUF3592 domain-containing protein [Desemzia sp. RIT 804]